MKKHFLLLVSLCFALTALAAPKMAEHVFIVSIDQGAPAGIHASEMPVLKKMAAEGARTWEAYTIVPSSTLQAHVSMATGVGIQKHQIVWNDDKSAASKSGALGVPTIFALAKERGLKTALIVGKAKILETLNLPGSLDAAVCVESGLSLETARVAAEKIVALKPNLCLIHLSEPDPVGHEFGMFSPEKKKAFADADAALQILRDAVKEAGLEEKSLFIVTADHGGHDREPGDEKPPLGRHGWPIKEDVEIPWIAWGKGARAGTVITAPVVIYDTAATALWVLGVELPEHFWGRPVVSAFK